MEKGVSDLDNKARHTVHELLLALYINWLHTMCEHEDQLVFLTFSPNDPFTWLQVMGAMFLARHMLFT